MGRGNLAHHHYCSCQTDEAKVRDLKLRARRVRFLLGTVILLPASAAFAQAPPSGTPFLFVSCGAPDQQAKTLKALLADSATPDVDPVAATNAIALGKTQYGKALELACAHRTFQF